MNDALVNWEEFESEVRRLAESTDAGMDGVRFRGLASADWPLSTTLERAAGGQLSLKEYYRLMYLAKPEVDAFTSSNWVLPPYEHLDQLTRDFDRFSLLHYNELPAADFMVYLRHHGFPSPLLDWTRSPYVAAYFAFRERNSANSAIYAFVERPDSIKTWSSDDPLIVPFRTHTRSHRRHFLQQSAYTMCLRFEEEWRFEPHDAVFNTTEGQDRRFKFVIPSSERVKVLEILDRFNLNSFSLFGTEESLMETIALRIIDLDI